VNRSRMRGFHRNFAEVLRAVCSVQGFGRFGGVRRRGLSGSYQQTEFPSNPSEFSVKLRLSAALKCLRRDESGSNHALELRSAYLLKLSAEAERLGN